MYLKRHKRDALATVFSPEKLNLRCSNLIVIYFQMKKGERLAEYAQVRKKF